MCGLAGWIGRIADKQVTAERMRQAMLHRGPDEQRIQHFENATLVHNRLKILDLSASGAQPMSNEDGTVWIVFNGEIYNYAELREVLQKKGHTFRSRTDTEVILHLYEEKGTACTQDLKGMFAFAVYDSKQKTCFLARDRFGIKPLFYSIQKDFIAFASEINALKQVPGLPLEIDQQAVFDYSALFYIPAPLTFYKSIRALMPGQSALIRQDLTIGFVNNNHVLFVPDKNLSEAQTIAHCEALLSKAVKKQLRSDVPLGALLSGGIDSSLVSYFAQKNTQSHLKTFNVEFPEKEYDETWAAVAVAEHIGSEHRTLTMDSRQGSWEKICSMLLHAGQPYADTSLFAMDEVSRLIRQYVTVALSGDGGDEGFGGYNFYTAISSNLFLLGLTNVIPKWVQPLFSFFPFQQGLPGKINRIMGDFRGADDVTLLQYHFTWMRERKLKTLWRGPLNLLPIRRYFQPAWDSVDIKNLPKVERFSAALSQVSADLVLANDFLFKVDTASMRHGLEVRVPMLDEDLVAFASGLPHRLKVNGKTAKRILRGLSQKLLPKSVANKPKKGFGVPVDTWVDGNFKRKTKEFLTRPDAKIRHFFNPSIYEVWINDFCDNKRNAEHSRQGLYQCIVMLLSLELHLGKT